MTTKGPATLPDDRRLRVNASPVQRPNRDRLVRRAEYGGPAANTDARLYVDAATLRQLLSVAEASLTGRAVMHHAGVVVELYESPTGHAYECWRLIASHVTPEPSPFVQP